MNRIYQKKKNELMHYGVPGMKWGIRKAVQLYNTADKHGSKVLNQKADKYAMKRQRATNDGHKLRAAYYKHKQYKAEDSLYEDIDRVYAGMKDVSTKALAVRNAAQYGQAFMKSYMHYKRET